MNDQQGWRCPLCGERVAVPADHMRTAHGVGATAEDRFGLRRAASERRRRDRLPARARPSRRVAPAHDEVVEPAKPVALPPETAILRLTCEPLHDVDAGQLQARLAELPGVEAAAIDLYERTIDLYLDRDRAAPPHLVALTSERLRLPVTGAELHRQPLPGTKLGDDTRLLVLF